MTRACPSLLLPLLAIAACQAERKPLTGFDKPPPGSLVLDWSIGNTMFLWPLFSLPQTPQQVFRPRLNGQDAVVVTSDEGFYDYDKLYLNGWTGDYGQWIGGIPAGTYVVELIDSTGQSWGQSPPLPIAAGVSLMNPGTQSPGVIFANFDGQVGSWTIDPTKQDADAATDEITATNLLAEDVVVERCQIAAGSRTSCTPIGTMAPGADLHTVETLSDSAMADHQALFFRLASDASQSFQRDLLQPAGGVGYCQIERIIVHGRRQIPNTQSGVSPFAMTTCPG